jgi:arsenical pump membrane protein
VLNLDTTIVLLTPLYVRLARRSGEDPVGLALVPLLLAAFASSVLPVSNLTNLIVTERLDVGTGDFLGRLALPALAATAVGWLAYRRRWPTALPPAPVERPDGRALAVGGVVVAALLVAFVAGPSVGIDPWMSVVVADVVLVAITRWVPWRDVPVATAALVAAVAAVVALVVPPDAVSGLLGDVGPGGVALAALGATAVADAVNNLPALLVGIAGAEAMTWGTWAWLLGVNVGSVLLPIGALANLLWWRIARDEEVELDLRRYVGLVVPVAVPALAAAIAVLVVERAVAG